jgi:hypothetical protein
MFKGYFPNLKEYWLDENGCENKVHDSNFWRDPVIWRIKNAPVLVREHDAASRQTRGRYFYGRVTKPEMLEFSKYYDQLRLKPYGLMERK